MVVRRTFRLSRDTVLFVSGLLGIIYETVIEHGDRPTLLVLFGAMVGLPAFLKADESKSSKHDDPEPPEAPPPPKVEP